MCEGSSEVQLITKLIEDGYFLFDKKDILDRKPIHARQPKTVMPLINILPISEDITFYRIGDTQKDEFDLSCFCGTRIEHIKVVKVCTKPELEILVIINEGLYKEYLKVKSKVSPKQFVKTNLTDYTNMGEYLENHSLLFAIKEYKRIKNKDEGELYLADLLKDADQPKE